MLPSLLRRAFNPTGKELTTFCKLGILYTGPIVVGSCLRDGWKYGRDRPQNDPSPCSGVYAGILSCPGPRGALFVSAHVQMAHLSVCSCPLCSLPVCLQSRPCRETQSWSWRAAPWPLCPMGTASWRPVSLFPRSPGRMGSARARAVLSVCTPIPGD